MCIVRSLGSLFQRSDLQLEMADGLVPFPAITFELLHLLVSHCYAVRQLLHLLVTLLDVLLHRLPLAFQQRLSLLRCSFDRLL